MEFSMDELTDERLREIEAGEDDEQVLLARHVRVMREALRTTYQAAEGSAPYGDDGRTLHLSDSFIEALRQATEATGKFAETVDRKDQMRTRMKR